MRTFSHGPIDFLVPGAASHVERCDRALPQDLEPAARSAARRIRRPGPKNARDGAGWRSMEKG
jgi:hypothetical protein